MHDDIRSENFPAESIWYENNTGHIILKRAPVQGEGLNESTLWIFNSNGGFWEINERLDFTKNALVELSSTEAFWFWEFKILPLRIILPQKSFWKRLVAPWYAYQ